MPATTHARSTIAALTIAIANLLVSSPASACAQMPAVAALEARLEYWHRSGVPLLGRIWERGELISPDRAGGCAAAALGTMLRSELVLAASIVLLGEVHDNAQHHFFRAELTAARDQFVKHQPPNSHSFATATVFEHIRAEQKPALERFAAKPGSADDLLAALDWDKSGWPDRKLFAPLFEAVIQARLPIHAGDPSRETIRKVAKEGEATLPEEERKRLGLDQPLPAESQQALLDDLEKSHCGLMPKTAFGKLAYAQRYRDAWLADAVVAAAKEHGSAILFAGNGHVRADRGVPWYIRERAPDKKVVTVMLVEVEDGKTKPEDYDLKGDDGKPVADFVVFTPRAERPDPCEDMRKMFERRAGKGK